MWFTSEHNDYTYVFAKGLAERTGTVFVPKQ